MRHGPAKHHRRSLRLKGYDYSLPGAYFVTVVTQGQACLFGEVVDGTMRLNGAGQMVQAVWNEIPAHYPGVAVDAFVVMPNHIHGIVILVGAAPCGRPNPRQPQGMGQPRGVAPTLSLPEVMARFKALTTKRYIDGVRLSGWPPFHGRLWQRNYYEHIIRNEASLARIREYILNNPLRWEKDPEKPPWGVNVNKYL